MFLQGKTAQVHINSVFLLVVTQNKWTSIEKQYARQLNTTKKIF